MTNDYKADPEAADIAVTPPPSWLGRVVASIVCGTLGSLLLGLAITIFVPGYDGLDEAFMGGLFFLLAWPIAVLWILFSRSSRHAWARGLVPVVVLALLSVWGLFS